MSKRGMETEIIATGFIPEDEIIDWVKRNLNPDDVFDEKELSSWAEVNGYILKERNAPTQ